MKRLLLLLALLVGCMSPEGAETFKNEQYKNQQRDIIDQLEYHQDYRTGLCFATRDLYSYWALLTEVPCTDKVKGLIK